MRTAAVPNRFFEASGSSGTSAATVLPAAVSSQLAQPFRLAWLAGSRPKGFSAESCASQPLPQAIFQRGKSGARAACRRAPDGARAVSSRTAALGRRRFAPPCRARSRATRLPLPHPREHCDSCTRHASPRNTRLDAEPSAGYDHQEQRSGALGPGLLGNVQVNGEGAHCYKEGESVLWNLVRHHLLPNRVPPRSPKRSCELLPQHPADICLFWDIATKIFLCPSLLQKIHSSSWISRRIPVREVLVVGT